MKLIEDFNDIPSLEFLTASQVVITIWNRMDIVSSITNFLDYNGYERVIDDEWNKTENKVQEIVGNLTKILKIFKSDMEALTKQIGFHIRGMRTFMAYSPFLAYPYDELPDFYDAIIDARPNWRNKFCAIYLRLCEDPVEYWTPYGTVDTERFDKMLMQNIFCDIELKFNLACIDCFEEDIKDLIPLLTDHQKLFFKIFEIDSELPSYWVFRLSDNLSEYLHSVFSCYNTIVNDIRIPRDVRCFYDDVLNTVHDCHTLAFKCTLRDGSKSGIKYFQQFFLNHYYPLSPISPTAFKDVLKRDGGKLASRKLYKPHKNILPPRPREQFADALYFLLTQLNENQRKRYFKKNSFGILKNFLIYPFFGLFSKYVGNLMRHLNNTWVSKLLTEVYQRENMDIYLYGYDLFKDVWCKCSPSQKKFIRNHVQNLSDNSHSLNFKECMLEKMSKLDEETT